MISARAIIAKLRQTQPLTKSELNWFAKGLSDNSITDAQRSMLPNEEDCEDYPK